MPRLGAVGAGTTNALLLAEPNELSPGFSHSRPIRVSHPLGSCRSFASCARHASKSAFHVVAVVVLVSAAKLSVSEASDTASNPIIHRLKVVFIACTPC